MKNAKKKIERKNRLIEGAQLQKISSYTLIFFRKNHKKLAKIKKFKKIQKNPKNSKKSKKSKKIPKKSEKIQKFQFNRSTK
jgi:hypothetical protein